MWQLMGHALNNSENFKVKQAFEWYKEMRK